MIGEVRYTSMIHLTSHHTIIRLQLLIYTGWTAFEMQELSALEKPKTEKDTFSLVPATTPKEKRTFAVRFNRAYLTNAAAVAAVIILSFFFSTPIENTEVIEENYATLLPDELFEKIENNLWQLHRLS